MVEKGKKQFANSESRETRYPGDFEPVDEQEYQETLETAEKVFNWVSNLIEGDK